MDQIILTKERSIKDKKLLFVNKLIFVVIVLSETIYFIFTVKCIVRLKKTKEWNFIFPLVASLFAFMNNLNDIIYTIIVPLKPNVNCNELFLKVFSITGIFNWTPISFLQIIRLYQLTRRYYTPNWHRLITSISVSLSVIYCCCYYYNLTGFKGINNEFLGCAIYNIQDSYLVEISDILDSGFSLIIIISTIRKALDNLKKYKLRHKKLKAFKDESVFVFIILTVSKIIIYTVILIFSKKPGGDIFWDILSVIVISCSYRIVNFKPKLNEKLQNSRNLLINKNIKYRNMKKLKDINQKVQNNTNNTNNDTNNNYDSYQNISIQSFEHDEASSDFAKNIEFYNKIFCEENFQSLIYRDDYYSKNSNIPKNYEINNIYNNNNNNEDGYVNSKINNATSEVNLFNFDYNSMNQKNIKNTIRLKLNDKYNY